MLFYKWYALYKSTFYLLTYLLTSVYRTCSGEYVELLQLKPKDFGKSGVWDKFRLVIYDGKAQEYVCCTKCYILLKYLSRDGTTGLQKHSCVSTKSYPHLDTFMASARAVPSSVKSDLADAAVVMCATDIRPFDIVEGAGFQQFCRKLLQIGKSTEMA